MYNLLKQDYAKIICREFTDLETGKIEYLLIILYANNQKTAIAFENDEEIE